MHVVHERPTSDAATKGLAAFPGATDVPEEQVRFAVVLNGGVSLAVWMGGVVLELDRLTKAHRTGKGAYALLQRLTGCSCRADVITGTSAGGINGAALALTQVNRDANPALLRDLWIDEGRIESLLRQPFQGQPTSLLKGDEYFLPKLNAALSALAKPGPTWADARSAPIDLSITTTVLRGNQAVSVDSMGQQIPQSIHAGRFHWKRETGRHGRDPFSREELRRTAHRLALASRSSASFPVAFEPSFVPVGSRAHEDPGDGQALTEELRLRPDMGDHVESWGTNGVDSDRSRYVVDGGALANTPTLAALEAVESMPAEGPVRRVMLLVFPHAPSPGLDPPDSLDEPPTFAGALSGILGALTAQGGQSHVEALDRHNLAAAGRRGTRVDILEELTNPAELASLTASVYGQYKRLRRWRAGRDLAAWRTGMSSSSERAAADLPSGWNFERVQKAAKAAQQSWADESAEHGATREELPYVPNDPPRAEGVDFEGWGWGVSAALGVTEAVSELLRTMVWAIRPGPDYETLTEARGKVFEVVDDLRDCRDHTDRVWREDPALVRLAPDEGYWTLRLACYDHLMRGGVGLDRLEGSVSEVARSNDVAPEVLRTALAPMLDRGPAWVGREVRAHIDRTLDLLRDALPILDEQVSDMEQRSPGLRHWHRFLQPEDKVALTDAELLARLLQLEITSTTLGEEVTTGTALPVELVQISAQTANPFTRHTVTGNDKLGGASLNRFSGFLKRSWRINDWLWGRVDGATMLCRAMLDPKRVRRTAQLSGYLNGRPPADLARETVEAILAELPTMPPDEADNLREEAIAELTKVFDVAGCRSGDLPSALPSLANIFALAVHLDVVPAELPVLAQAVRADRVDGANPRSRGEVFVAEHAELLGRLEAAGREPQSLSAEDRLRALEVFDRAGIGREPMREEATSDLIIRTASSAAAVMTTVADSDQSGFTAAKPVTRALRGAMLLPYWAITGLTSRQTISRWLALMSLALGGVLLALALFGALPEGLSGPAAALGGGAVLAGFAYGALRTGSLLHGIVLLTPLIPLVVYAMNGAGKAPADGDVHGVSTLVVVLVLALCLMLLGSLGFATGSVWAALDRLADRQGIVGSAAVPGQATRNSIRPWLRRVRAVVRLALDALAVLVAIALVAAAAWWLTSRAVFDFVQDNQRWLWIPAVLLVIASGVVAHFCSRWLQVLTRRDADVEQWAYAAVVNPLATAAGWSVLYGAGYLIVAWILSLDVLGLAEDEWARAGFATAVLFAVVLLAVLPIWLPVRAIRAAGLSETTRAATLSDPRTYPSQRERRALFAEGLAVRGVSYRRFVRPVEDKPGLTKAGSRLEQRVCDAHAAASLRAVWRVPRRPTAEDLQRMREQLASWEAGAGSVISPAFQPRVDELRRELSAEQADGETIQHAFERLVAALLKSRGALPKDRSPGETKSSDRGDGHDAPVEPSADASPPQREPVPVSTGGDRGASEPSVEQTHDAEPADDGPRLKTLLVGAAILVVVVVVVVVVVGRLLAGAAGGLGAVSISMPDWMRDLGLPDVPDLSGSVGIEVPGPPIAQWVMLVLLPAGLVFLAVKVFGLQRTTNQLASTVERLASQATEQVKDKGYVTALSAGMGAVVSRSVKFEGFPILEAWVGVATAMFGAVAGMVMKRRLALGLLLYVGLIAAGTLALHLFGVTDLRARVSDMSRSEWAQLFGLVATLAVVPLWVVLVERRRRRRRGSPAAEPALQGASR
jgi:patatin-related protein